MMKIELTIKQINSVSELKKFESGVFKRNIGLLYFQLMENNGFIPRVVTNETNGEWLIKMINQKRIFISDEKIKAELI